MSVYQLNAVEERCKQIELLIYDDLKPVMTDNKGRHFFDYIMNSLYEHLNSIESSYNDVLEELDYTIAEHHKEVQSLESCRDEMEEELEDFKKDFADLETEFVSLEDKQTDLETKYEALFKLVEKGAPHLLV